MYISKFPSLPLFLFCSLRSSFPYFLFDDFVALVRALDVDGVLIGVGISGGAVCDVVVALEVVIATVVVLPLPMFLTLYSKRYFPFSLTFHASSLTY